MKARTKRDSMIRETRERVNALRKKQSKIRKKRKLKYGGIKSLEFERTLILNREKVLEKIKDKGELKKFLELFDENPERFLQKIKVKESKTGPAINFILETSFVSGNFGGQSFIANIEGIGPVAVNLIYGPSESYRKRTKIHEEAHTRTIIMRHGQLEYKSILAPGIVQEKLFRELISKIAEKGGGREEGHTHFNIIGEYSKEYAEKRGLDWKEQRKIEKIWEKKFDEKTRAVKDALKHLQKGEVLMVLRKSSWSNLERDLKKRMTVRKIQR